MPPMTRCRRRLGPSCTSVSRTGSSRTLPSSWSWTRSSATTSSRPTPTAASSVRSTTLRALSLRARPSGCSPPPGARSTAATYRPSRAWLRVALLSLHGAARRTERLCCSRPGSCSSSPTGEGIRQADEIIEKAAGHPPLEAIATVVRGALKGLQGRIEEGRTELRAGRALFFEMGQLQYAAGTAMIEGDLELAAGEPAAAEAVLKESYEFMRKTAETGFVVTIVGYRAVAALELGREEEALAFADEVERNAQPDDFEPHVRQGCGRARVLARRGDHDAAAQAIRTAVAVGEATG